MRRIAPLVLVILLAGCASTREPSFGEASADAPVRLHVIPVLEQEELAVQVIVANSAGATAQYGAIGGLLGAIIDSSINNSRARKAERKAEVLREASADLPLLDSFAAATDLPSEGVGWRIVSVADISGRASRTDAVSRAFADDGLDEVVVLAGRYEMVPELDQFALRVDQTFYERSPSKRSGFEVRARRSFTYLSPMHPVVERAFRPGEREALAATLREEYEQALEASGADEDALRKALAEELEDLEEADSVPESVAIAEAWTSERLTRYFGQAERHIARMIAFDWNERSFPELSNPELDRYMITNALGTRTSQRGRRIEALDDNVIYRARDTSLHSVPAEDS